MTTTVKRKARAPKTCGMTAKGRRNELGTVGTLTRTKSLLRAALRVWELKNRIQD